MIETALVIPDLHCDKHDKKFIRLVTQLIRNLKPNYVIQLGDAMDFSTISTYLNSADSQDCIMKDIAAYNLVLDEWQAAMMPGSAFHQLEGNHCERAGRYIARNCRAIHELVKPIPEMLKFKERSRSKIKFYWHKYHEWDSCKIHDVNIFHGTYFDKHVAVNNLDRYKSMKTIQGHSHRFSYAADGKVWSVSLGHGSDAQKTAHIPAPNTWQQAIGVITFVKGKGHFEPILVTNGEGVFRGQTFKA